jgi:hypothetical protein
MLANLFVLVPCGILKPKKKLKETDGPEDSEKTCSDLSFVKEEVLHLKVTKDCI